MTMGRNGSTTYNDLWEYDPAGNTWTQKANCPGATRSEASTFVIGSIAYVGSGHTGAVSDFWAYDQSSNMWSAIASLPGTAERNEAVGFAIGSKGYIAQGAVVGSGTQKDLWEYSPSTTGTDELNSALAVSAYPNPSTGVIHLAVDSRAGGNYSLEVYDLRGEKILTTEERPASIDLSPYPGGVYFIRIKSPEGSGNYLEGIQKIIIVK
jgi:N-acetylneuraminic acid mutarotase